MTAAELYLNYQRDVRRTARKLVRSRADAEEIVSATFELLAKVLAEKERAGADPRRLALGVCANLAKHFQRDARRNATRQERYASEPSEDMAPDPESLLLQKELLSEAQAALARLPEAQQAAFLLACVEGRPMREVAELSGVPEATVRTRVFHARRKLREALAQLSPLRVAVALIVLLVVTGGAVAATHPGFVKDLVGRVGSVLEGLLPKATPPQSGLQKTSTLRVSPTLMFEDEPLAAPDLILPRPQKPVRTPSPRAEQNDDAPQGPIPRVDPTLALFAEANRLHFALRQYDDALRTWEQYLEAAPAGPLAAEARYNRALALIRLGQIAEAENALLPFALNPGGYRSGEARRLLENLSSGEALSSH